MRVSTSRRSRLLRLLFIAAALTLSMLLALGIAGALYAPDHEIPAGFPGKHVVVNGIPLRIVQQGSGRDVLLIHGSPGSIEDWSVVMAGLDERFRVTAFDRPGHGFSGDMDDHSIEANADIAAAVIETLELRNVIVVGHSYGGATALALTARKPVAVAANVIVDSATYVSSRKPDPMLRVLAMGPVGVGVARALGGRLVKDRIARGLTESFGGRAPDKTFIELRQRLWATPKVTHAIAEEVLSSPESLQRLSPSYPRIGYPTFILGQAGNEFRRTTAERLHRDIEGSVLRLVPDTGHYIQVEQPAEVIDAIERAAAAS